MTTLPLFSPALLHGWPLLLLLLPGIPAEEAPPPVLQAAAGALASPSPPPRPTGAPVVAFADTTEGVRRVTTLLRNHYGRGSARRARGSPDASCDGGEGQRCFGGDPDRGACPVNVPCHTTEEFLLRGLAEAAREHPTSGYVMGQAVYALTKFGRIVEADALLRECGSEEWLCEALRGYLLFVTWQTEEAEARFRRAVSLAPEDVRCALGDALPLLGEWDPRYVGERSLPAAVSETEAWSCARRLAASDTLWWWADPLLSREGNERWTVHVARALAGRFAAEIGAAARGIALPEPVLRHDWAVRVRRGPLDSYERLPGLADLVVYTSPEAARYHFVPDVSPGDLQDPVWRPDADLRWEGYTPDWGPLVPLPVQLARFRRGDSLRLAAAAGVRGTPLRRVTEAVGHLVLSDRPGSFPARARMNLRREDPRFLLDAPLRTYLVGLEVETELGVGWHREILDPLEPSGPALSDLLLYDGGGSADPDSLADALGGMLGSTTVPAGEPLGVFWEVYGAAAGSSLRFELSLEREEGGLVDRITGLFPLGARDEPGSVVWSEEARGDPHPRGIRLTLGGQPPGRYSLVLRVEWPGQEPLERRRSFNLAAG